VSAKCAGPAGLDDIRDGLARLGYREADIQAIMRDNLLRLIARVWK